MASLYFNSQTKASFMRHQSVYDPDRKSILMNYNLEDFKNSIWENFLGSQVQISKTMQPDGTYKITNRNVDKMGPVQLRIEEGNLYQAWEKSRRSEIDAVEGDKPEPKKVIETWVCRPPNLLVFQLNRVQYDMTTFKLKKDNSEFHFDKEIYLDLFLNQNKDRSDTHLTGVEEMKKELKQRKEEREIVQKNDITKKLRDCQEFIMSQINSPAYQSMSEKEIFIAQQVLNNFERSQQDNDKKVQDRIELLEKKVQNPYIQNMGHKYLLHGIMIHDGMAENGHYYSYIFDRTKNVWWLLNDHYTKIVSEEKVMEDAIGNSQGYKSACNLFYVSEHVAGLMLNLTDPVYTERHSETLQIPQVLKEVIQNQNNQFLLEVQNYVYTKKVDEIIRL